MLEKHIEQDVCRYARKKGWVVYKFTSPGTRGVPDRIFMRDGVVFFIEFKSPGQKPSRLQECVHRRIREQGIDVYVVDGIEQGCKLIDDVSYSF